MASVLIVDDEPNIRRMVGALLSAEGYEVTEAASGAQAIAKAAEDEPDVLLLDLMMPGEMDGLQTLARIRVAHPEAAVIMMSGRAGLSDAVAATKLGAVNFLEKPLTPEGVLFAIGSALELRQSRRVARELRAELGLAGDMVGVSAAMTTIRDLIDRVGASDARVLITGESGTGKELVASAIHDASTRREKPFIRVNCAAIPRDLVESEMFGHERGSFTGATQARIGRFELAHTGTLFLDEIGDLSLDAQAKLLRAIEGGEIQRVGGNRNIRADVRIIAATNQDLTRAVKDGTFREDLFFRLNVIPIALPALRDRKGDVPELVRHFSLLHFKRTGQIPPTWTPGAMQVLESCSWPGNVRELANIVERIAIIHPGIDVTSADIRSILNPAEAVSAPATGGFAVDALRPERSLADNLDDYERRLVSRALADADGNVAEAARRLQTDRPNLYRRMKRLGLAFLSAAICLFAGSASAQVEAVPDTTLDLGFMLGDDESGRLTLSSGKTYNRVEGLPILFGPTYETPVGNGRLSLAALGLIRSAHRFSWDSENLGHQLSASLRYGRSRGITVGAESFDVVSKIEPWQLTEPDGGLAAFFLKRDYFDFFGRHGARAYASAFRGNASITAGYSDERWSSRGARDVYSLFRGDDAWRENPTINDGRAHVMDLGFRLDTRNNALDPLDGWYLRAQYERGVGDFETDQTSIEPTRPDGRADLRYGRLFLDLRSYKRISPRRKLNARLVLGGWLHGDELPYQRRFSVGGIGTLPGFDFRRTGLGTDVGQCSSETTVSTARPAECERVALAQIEYRQELPSELFDIFNRNRIRVRGAVFRVKPDFVAFADAGRGWLVGPRAGTLTYSAGSLPGIDTFRTDVGVGLDLGIAGVYVAKAVSESKEPANFFVRIRSRF